MVVDVVGFWNDDVEWFVVEWVRENGNDIRTTKMI
jgi:hypothetical protein